MKIILLFSLLLVGIKGSYDCAIDLYGAKHCTDYLYRWVDNIYSNFVDNLDDNLPYEYRGYSGTIEKVKNLIRNHSSSAKNVIEKCFTSTSDRKNNIKNDFFDLCKSCLNDSWTLRFGSKFIDLDSILRYAFDSLWDKVKRYSVNQDL